MYVDVQRIVDMINDSFEETLKEDERLYDSFRNRLEEILEEKWNRSDANDN